MESYRIEGIYSEGLLQKTTEKRILEFSFDLRPTSPTFIQLYRLIEILENTSLSGKEKVYLRFHYEKDFIISEFLKNIRDANLPLPNENFILEFSAVEDFRLMEGMGHPYVVHYHQNIDWAPLTESTLMSGIVFPFAVLDQLHQSGTYMQAMGELFKRAGHRISRRCFEIQRESTQGSLRGLFEERSCWWWFQRQPGYRLYRFL